MRGRSVLAVIGCLLVALLGAPVASAAAIEHGQPVAAAQQLLASPGGGNGNGNGGNGNGAGSGGVQRGPDLPRQQQESDQRLTQNKAIIGAVAAVLLLVVFFGRRQRNRTRRRVKNLKNAKA